MNGGRDLQKLIERLIVKMATVVVSDLEGGLRLMPVTRLKAVHQMDLLKLMASLGKEQELRQGKLNCHFCHTTVTGNNLGTVFPYQGEVRVSCDAHGCFDALLDLREGRSARA